MKSTTLSLQNCGRGEVNLVREIKVTIKQAAFITDATIQVKTRAPVNLLLGTDGQPHLSFIFLASDADGSAEELLIGEMWTCDNKNKAEPMTTGPPPSVPHQTESPTPSDVHLATGHYSPHLLSLLQSWVYHGQCSH